MRLRIFTEPQQGASYGTLRRVAKAAEDLGFDAFFRSDHYLKMGSGSGDPGPTDAWATLAALAVETSTIRLGTLVTAATFRLPGPLAITVAQVDEMSGGRVEFGLGTGWFDGEHRGLRHPVPAAEGAVRPLRGAARDHHRPVVDPGRPDVLLRRRALLSSTDSPALPKPAQRPRPPVIIGGGGARRTPALAARYADEFNAAFRPRRTWRWRFGRVREACAAGREPGDSMSSPPPRWSAAARTRPSSPAAPRRSAVTWPTCGKRPGGHALGDRGQDRRVRRGRRHHRSTCRSSTCPTSTTSTCSPPRCCPRSSHPPRPAPERLLSPTPSTRNASCRLRQRHR